MSAPDHADGVEAGMTLAPASDPNAALEALRTVGAQRFDPVRMRHLELLAARASVQPDGVRLLLHARLRHGIADLTKRFEFAKRDAAQALSRSVQDHPGFADEWQGLLDAGDFRTLRQSLAARRAGSGQAALRALTDLLTQHAHGNGAGSEQLGDKHPELKAIREFRTVWSKLSVDRQVSQALRQAPKNAGPINSHMLALRSLALMREISPDYLNRFISYTETLLCLDQAEQDKTPKPKKRTSVKAAKK